MNEQNKVLEATRSPVSRAPYDGDACTRRNHVVPGTKIDPSDTRLFACDCRCAMIGNGFVEIRFGLLPHRFPEADDV
jgi:hypothetical protein